MTVCPSVAQVGRTFTYFEQCHQIQHKNACRKNGDWFNRPFDEYLQSAFVFLWCTNPIRFEHVISESFTFDKYGRTEVRWNEYFIDHGKRVHSRKEKFIQVFGWINLSK